MYVSTSDSTVGTLSCSEIADEIKKDGHYAHYVNTPPVQGGVFVCRENKSVRAFPFLEAAPGSPLRLDISHQFVKFVNSHRGACGKGNAREFTEGN